MRGPFKNTGVMPEGDVVQVRVAWSFGDEIHNPLKVGKETYVWDTNYIHAITEYWLSDEEEVVLEDITNPKQSQGLSKLPLHLWPGLATAYGSIGLLGGALRYGESNFKATPVQMSIYLAAILRHTYAIMDGQENDEVDGSPHLGAILANCAIILEARAVGTLVDDRQMIGGYVKEAEGLTKIANNLKEMYGDRKPRNYTIEDSIK